MSQFKPFGDLPRRLPRPSYVMPSAQPFDTPPHSPTFMDLAMASTMRRQPSQSSVESSATKGDDASTIASTTSDTASGRFVVPLRTASRLSAHSPTPPLVDTRAPKSPPLPPEKSPSRAAVGPKSPLRARMASGRNTPVSLAVKVPSMHELELTPPSLNTLWRSDSVKTSGSTIRTESEDSGWDSYDSTPATPMRERFQSQLSTPLAVQFVQRGKGVLSVVSSEESVQKDVTPGTTHLSMKNCALANYEMLRIPNMLVVLDLSGSQLTELPMALAQCTSLEELNISRNPFGRSMMNTPLGSLRALEHLRVLLADECELRAVPQEIIMLTSLQILGLRRNMLLGLPSWLYVLDFLDCLLLEGNHHLRPVWKSILHPLLTMDDSQPPSPLPVSHSDTQTDSTIASPITPPLTARAEVRKRSGTGSSGASTGGLFNKFMASSRSSSHSDRSASISRAPSRSRSSADSKSSSSSQAGQTSSTSRSSHGGGLVLPQHTPTKTFLTPVPLSTQVPASSPAHPEIKPLLCFLPVREESDGTEALLAWFARTGTALVRHLRAYLRDMDNLLPERHREVPGSAMSLTGSSGIGSPNMSFSAMSSGGGSDPTSRCSPGEVFMRNGILDEAGEAVTMQAVSRVKENAIKRYCVLREIVETERTYVAGLTELMDIYLKRVRQPMDGVSDDRVLSVEKERLIFGHVEVIIQFHQEAFLPELERKTAVLLSIPEVDEERHAQLSAHVAAEVANVFSNYSAYFKMYTSYINQYDTALRLIAQWHDPLSPRVKSAIKSSGSSLASLGQRFLHLDTSSSSSLAGGSPSSPPTEDNAMSELPPISYSEHKRMQLFLKRCKNDPRHSQINLEGYLLLPIQRIPRYRLLLEQLVKCTSHGVLLDIDREALARALAHISLVASWVNEGKRQSEQGKRLLQWQSRLRGSFSAPLVQPHRRLVCDGSLRLLRVTKRVHPTASLDHASGTDEDALEQLTLDITAHLLLCNDLMVVVVPSSTLAEESSPLGSKQRSASVPGTGQHTPETSMLDLLAVLKPQVYTFPPGLNGNVTMPPASTVGPAQLRVVDAKYIYYFLTSSHREALRWQSLINAQV